ncbi:MAG: valine--tRNA ligase [Candidatus Glassbacteria bacterium RBG_16_58_8]|uniref:Valine--tRNA ligase n=1 Tax=Candidatus Glassbacteria bacterium RBG_16_58_8 TaxID=1817866 RepID=A0A1F5YCS5_9BACT|nr:MAG: valine--tRNA ligase [Candidatus Glassbacteria bacterium RBG_16_58_8]
MTELAKRYDASEIEESTYRWWEERRFFTPHPSDHRTPYTIVIPPPNITGVLHMGHAFNVTYQDILIRWKRMASFKALWVPGSDHAGIATQNMVERSLDREGFSRKDLGRERFVEKIWEWQKKHGQTIAKQLRRLGTSCDWTRERFTMDEGLSRAVRKAFVHLYQKGLIYRGEYIINWCPRCSTALSDEEVEHREVDGKLYYIRYPLKGEDRSVTVATTRPETMLGDMAVAVHPDDERYREMIGKTAILPIIGREMAIIADPFVDREMGTGALKVTPGHDPNDFEMGKRHGLPLVNILNPDGSLNEKTGPFRGQDILTARKEILKRLEGEGFLEKIVPHLHMVGHCYRCQTIVEPYVSTQWFVRMRPLAEPALEAFRQGEYAFHPRRWEKIYIEWMENIRDWCISRQIWWGHRIPVWYCGECGGLTVGMDNPSRCSHCDSRSLSQDEDVLDTWFSSWLWPFSTLGWPDETADLEEFYPTDALVTAHEIIFFWVARMIMAGIEFMGKVPFRDVYIHGTIRDDTGRKMSKSLGNTIDPLDIISEFGADALRFSLISISSEGQDVYLAPEKFHIGRNLSNKLWNATRFLVMNLGEGFAAGEELPDRSSLELADRWILSRYHHTIGSVAAALSGFRFNEAASTLYDFFWHDFCDAYVELIKERWSDGGGERSKGGRDGDAARAIAWHVHEGTLRLFHPFIPFITEALWQKIPHRGETVVTAPWPVMDDRWIDSTAEAEMEYLREVIRQCLMLRTDYGVKPGHPVGGYLVEGEAGKRKILEAHSPYITRLAGIAPVYVHSALDPPRQVARAVFGTTQVFIPLHELIDVKKEVSRLKKEIDRLNGQRMSLEKRLADREFLEKAPENVVERERSKVRDFKETLERLEGNLRAIQGGD